MISEKIKWNEKYKTLTAKPPSKLLEYLPRALKSQKALDLAGGLGRNSFELVKKGYDVTLIDISDVALSKISHPQIKKICLDLDKFTIPQNEYDIIVMIKYFNLDLLKQIPDALKKQGFFIFETVKKYPISTEKFFEIFKDFETVYFTQTPFMYVGRKT
jgi:SAM-dependent methyltransferase